MMKLSLLTGTAVLLALLAGCVHFEYDGLSEPALGTEAKIYRDLKLPLKDGKMLGEAVVWGDYQDVPLDKLEARLQKEAAERGANMVCITAEQVLPGNAVVRVDPMQRTMDTVSPGNMYSLNRIQQDFDSGYGQAELFGKNARPKDKSAVAPVRDYKRIIRAKFCYCKNPPVQKNKKSVKKNVAAKKSAGKPDPPSVPVTAANSATAVADKLAAAEKKTIPAEVKKTVPAEVKKAEKKITVTVPPPIQ